uniref:Uncharacterized protein n=1 Tax=Globodera rostochiensis TaxID=31243 RepID=A0A914IGE8_GLORO
MSFSPRERNTASPELHVPTSDELETGVFSATAAVLNQRPISAVSAGTDAPVRLRPVDFIQPLGVISLDIDASDNWADETRLPPQKKWRFFGKHARDSRQLLGAVVLGVSDSSPRTIGMEAQGTQTTNSSSTSSRSNRTRGRT